MDEAGTEETGASGDLAKATFFVTGRVQGVGFRWWAKSKALELGLDGYARNLDDGRVEVCAQGAEQAVERMGELLGEKYSSNGRPGRVRHVVTQRGAPRADLGRFREC